MKKIFAVLALVVSTGPAFAAETQQQEFCRKQATNVVAAYSAYKAGFPEAQVQRSLSEMQPSNAAKQWASNMVSTIYADRLSNLVNTDDAYSKYVAACYRQSRLSSLEVRLPRGSAGD